MLWGISVIELTLHWLSWLWRSNVLILRDETRLRGLGKPYQIVEGVNCSTIVRPILHLNWYCTCRGSGLFFDVQSTSFVMHRPNMVNTATHPVVELDYNKAPDVAVTPSLGNTQILGSNGALYLIPQLPEVTTAEYSHQDRSSNTAADARIHKSVVASDQLPPRQEDTAGLGRPLGRHFDLDHLNSSDHESFKPKLPSTTSFTEPQRAQLNNEGVNKDYEARSSPHSTPDSSTANLITSQPLHLIFESVRKGLEITTSLHSPFEPPVSTSARVIPDIGIAHFLRKLH